MDDPDLNGILRRIIMEPDVDLHRLVYADRLDELDCANYAAHVRWAVTHPQNAGVCLCVDPRQRPCDRCSLIRSPVLDATRRTDGETHYVEHRGFVDELRLDAATFLAHADELVWHETQTVECPKCRGDGSYEIGFHSTSAGSHEYCARCGGTRSKPGSGRVPRPCPPSAQPIRKVVLTTARMPNEISREFYYWNDENANVQRYHPKWPGVEFELPATGTESVSDDAEHVPLESEPLL